MFGVQKGSNRGHSRCGLFLHEPVAGIGDDDLSHIGGGIAHDNRLGCSEGLLATDCKDRHGQLTHHRRLVVLDILGERKELGEG